MRNSKPALNYKQLYHITVEFSKQHHYSDHDWDVISICYVVLYLWKFTMFFKVKPLTEAELEAVTIVFHQYETGLREGTIYTRVSIDTGLKEKGIRNQSMGQLL